MHNSGIWSIAGNIALLYLLCTTCKTFGIWGKTDYIALPSLNLIQNLRHMKHNWEYYFTCVVLKAKLSEYDAKLWILHHFLCSKCKNLGIWGRTENIVLHSLLVNSDILNEFPQRCKKYFWIESTLYIFNLFFKIIWKFLRTSP